MGRVDSGRALLIVVLCLCGLGAGGCTLSPRPRVPDPSDTVAALADAIERDDPRAALGLLNAGAGSIEPARFLELWKENRVELQELAMHLRERQHHVQATARVQLHSGETVSLALEDGSWRLAGGVLDAQAHATPLDAVSALRRAILRRDLSGLMRALSRERRAAFAASFDRSVRATADPLDLRVETHGERAIVHTSDGGQIHLRRQAGRWYVTEVR